MKEYISVKIKNRCANDTLSLKQSVKKTANLYGNDYDINDINIIENNMEQNEIIFDLFLVHKEHTLNLHKNNSSENYCLKVPRKMLIEVLEELSNKLLINNILIEDNLLVTNDSVYLHINYKKKESYRKKQAKCL